MSGQHLHDVTRLDLEVICCKAAFYFPFIIFICLTKCIEMPIIMLKSSANIQYSWIEFLFYMFYK